MMLCDEISCTLFWVPLVLVYLPLNFVLFWKVFGIFVLPLNVMVHFGSQIGHGRAQVAGRL
jgi:hypothetical protein